MRCNEPKHERKNYGFALHTLSNTREVDNVIIHESINVIEWSGMSSAAFVEVNFAILEAMFNQNRIDFVELDRCLKVICEYASEHFKEEGGIE